MGDSPSVFDERGVFNSPRPLPALQAPREAPAEAPAEAPFAGNAAATNAQFLSTLRHHIDTYDVETNVSNHIFFGIMTPELLDCVKSTPPNRAREGGTGIVSKCSLVEGQEFYVKKIKGGPFAIGERGVQHTLEKYKNEIEKINNEININIAVSKKIPAYVSICEGAYLSYTIKDARISYEAYILFQYLPGLDLGTYLFRYIRADPIPNKDKILTNVSRCLAELHAVGYVHRDIKPDNIFLVSDNPDAMPPEQINVSRCILIDFGESLPIEALLKNIPWVKNLRWENIKGDERYNPFLHHESIPDFPWKPNHPEAYPDAHPEARENIRAFEFMRNTETGAFGFRRGGGRKKTNKKQKRRSRTRKHN